MGLRFRPIKNGQEKICAITNNSAVHCPIALKFDYAGALWVPGGRRIRQNVANGAQSDHIYRHKSATDCSISLKFGKWVHY